MSKIGINARFLIHPYTGIGQYTRRLVPEMAKMSPEDEFLLFTPELVDFPLPSNCRQVRVVEKPFRSASVRKAYWEQKLLPREMKRHQVDLAHYFYPSNPRQKMDIPTLVTVHDAIPWKLKSYQKKLRSKLYHSNAKRALRSADHLLTVSDFSKAEIADTLRLQLGRLTVTRLASPPRQQKRFSKVSLRRDYLLYVGGYDERKNVPRLIEAYQKHIAPRYAIDLILVGAKGKGLEALMTDQYLERIAGKYPLKAKGDVIFMGSVPSIELETLYEQALALAHVSTYEGFNVPLVEAMSQGLPIITSDIPVHREVTAGAALFVDPQNIDSIGLAMHRLVHDKALQKQLSEQSKLRASDFSWQKTAEETLRVYRLYA